MVVEISLRENLEKKKEEQIQGRINRRMPICNPTIQLVIANLYTKFEVSILNDRYDHFAERIRIQPGHPRSVFYLHVIC